jgi:hypothetical protein
MPFPYWPGRPKPTTRLRTLYRAFGRAIVILLLLYAGLQIRPQILFAHSVTAQGITIYSRAPLPPETTDRIAEIATLVARSELAVPGRQEKIFICNSPWTFRLFCPRTTGAFGASIFFTDHVFIFDADLSANLARRNAPEYNTRAFSPLVAHEITHGLIRHRLGTIQSFRLPDWINEGYCEYIAGEGSFPNEEGLRLLTTGQTHASSAFRYFLYRQLVTHLIDRRNLTFDEIVTQCHDTRTLEADLISSLRPFRGDK